MSHITQGVALGWYKLAFQAGIALSGMDEIHENLIAGMKATPCLTGINLCIKSSLLGEGLGGANRGMLSDCKFF